MSKTIERSISQVLYKYLPNSYADFDIKGVPITSRVVGWNDKIQENQNKKRILHELFVALNKYSVGEQNELNDFLSDLETRKTDSFDIRSLQGKRDENDKKPEIVTVLRPYVFFCKDCGLVHIITDYSAGRMNEYEYYIQELYSIKKHKCLECGGALRQQQIIRVSASGTAFDYEPYCEIHKETSKYRVKKGDTRDYFCEECNQVVKRKFIPGEDITPALDPKVFFPQIITMVDLKKDEKVEMINKIHYLSKLLVLSEFGSITEEKYQSLREILVGLYESGVDKASQDYKKKTREVKKVINHLNEPQFDTFENQSSYYYENLALRLLELKEIKNYRTLDFDDIISSNTTDNKYISKINIGRILKQCGIKEITISESVPINSVAFGYTRLFSDITEENKTKLRLYKDKKTNNYNLYSNKIDSEGVLIQFDREAILMWISENIREVFGDDLVDIYTETSDDFRVDFFNNSIRSNELHTIIMELLHSISHIFMKSISIASGIEVTSMSEILFPEVGAIFIYCTSNEGMVLNSIKTAVSKRLYYFLNNSLESINRCNLKNICESKDKQACLGCLLIPEISCKYFNNDLDRKLLSNLNPRQYYINSTSNLLIKKGMWTKWQK